MGHPVFRSVWFASLASNLGGLIQSVGAAWLMTSIAASDDMVALVQASTTLPIMIFSLAAGAIADNFDRRRVMLDRAGCSCWRFRSCSLSSPISDCINALAAAGLHLPDRLRHGAQQPVLAGLRRRYGAALRLLSAAVLLNSVNFNLTRSVGPAIGGIIVAAAGAAAAFTVNAAELPSADLRHRALEAGHPAQHAAAGDARPRHDGGAALRRHVAAYRKGAAARLRLRLFSAIIVLALLPLVARDLPGGGPLLYGLLLGCYGIGAIGGAFLGGRVRENWSNETIARAAFLGFAACVTIIAVSPNAWLVGWARDRRRMLGVGAVDVQRHGPTLDAALGARPGAGALPDGDLRRHGARRLGLGPGR